jgi:hypothetical protein
LWRSPPDLGKIITSSNALYYLFVTTANRRSHNVSGCASLTLKGYNSNGCVVLDVHGFSDVCGVRVRIPTRTDVRSRDDFHNIRSHVGGLLVLRRTVSICALRKLPPIRIYPPYPQKSSTSSFLSITNPPASSAFAVIRARSIPTLH